VQKILKWLTPLIAVGVAIFIINFLISINTNETPITLAPLEQRAKQLQKNQKKFG